MIRLSLIWLILCFMVVPVSAAGLNLEVGLDVASGDYGTDENLTAVTLPVTVRYATEHYSLALGIPWVSQSKGTTVLMGGRRFGHGMTGGAIGGGGGAGGGGMMGGSSGSSTGLNSSSSETGLGDVTLDADLVLLRSERGLLVSLLGYLKAPTGDEDKGLGTGAWDVGGGLSARQELDNWFLDGSLRAVVPGDNGDFQPDSYWEWTSAVGRYQGDHLWFSGGLEGATAPFDNAEDALDLVARFGWDGERYGYGGHLLGGLSDGSPDVGGGLFIYRNF